MNGTPRTQSRATLLTPLLTPMSTPKTESEGMSWETKGQRQPVSPKKPKALHGILKQKGSKQELQAAHAGEKADLRHRPSICEKCKHEMSTSSEPVPSMKQLGSTGIQSTELSETIARLEAERMAAEVEALHPKPPSLTPSSSSSEKSAGGAAADKSGTVAHSPAKFVASHEPCTTIVESLQEAHPASSLVAPNLELTMKPTTMEPKILNRVVNTKHEVGTQADPAEPNQTTSRTTMVPHPGHGSPSLPSSRFREEILDATRSTPALPVTAPAVIDSTPLAASTTAVASAGSSTSSGDPALISPGNSALENDASQETHVDNEALRQKRPRRRWHPKVTARSVWTALRKPKPKHGRLE